MHRLALPALLAMSAVATAAPKAPTMTAAQVVQASAAGAVVAATCGKGGADLHRRNARTAARDMLQSQNALPPDFDAQFQRVWAADDRRMRALTPAQRKQVCARMEAQGMRFRR